MNVPADTVVILFPGTSHVMRAEKLIVAAGVKCKLIPVPRHISATCGVCIRVSKADLEAALRSVREKGLEPAGIHED